MLVNYILWFVVFVQVVFTLLLIRSLYTINTKNNKVYLYYAVRVGLTGLIASLIIILIGIIDYYLNVKPFDF